MSEPEYHVKNTFPGSWDIHHDNKLIAKVESVHNPETPKAPGFVARIFGAKMEDAPPMYVVTHLPGASPKPFLTQSAAVQHAVNHHYTGGHIKVAHPMSAVKDTLRRLQRAIWASASDPRVTDNDQEKISELAKQHAQLQQTFNKHFPEV